MKRVLLIILLHLSLFFLVFAYQAQAEEEWIIDRFKDLFRSAFPSKEIMELKYGNLNKFKLYKIYISRIISLIFNRNNNT